MQSQQICLLASQIAKGGSGMVSIAGQGLNAVLEDLKLVRNLKMNRVTQTLTVGPGTYGPFPLETDYLRTYDMFYPLTTPGGTTQFLTQVTMEQFDAEPKQSGVANFPYEYATDTSTQAQSVPGTLGPANGVLGLTVTGAGNYGGIPTISFSGGTVVTPATAVALMGARSFLNIAGGTGYAVGDVVYGAAGTYTRPAAWVVTQVIGGGIIVSMNLIDAGSYSGLPTGPSFATTTAGAGVGCTMQIGTWFLVGATVTSPGVYYLNPPTASLSGGTPTVAGTLSVTFGAVSPSGTGQLYVYPMSATPLTITHRYMRNQPDIVTPETSSQVPWFPHSQYLIDRTAWFMMGITGDDRRDSFFKQTEEVLRPYLIMQGDEQQTVQAVRLDPRRFRRSGSLRPTKTDPY